MAATASDSGFDPISVYRRGRAKRRLATAAGAIAAMAAAASIAPASASAASRISGCFGYNGHLWSGLSTIVKYQTTSGGWASLPNSLGTTSSNGCISYTISGRARAYHLRIAAYGVVNVGPGRTGILTGDTPYYGRSGKQGWSLGTAAMSLDVLPPAAPSFGGIDTSQWLNEMTAPSSGNSCSSSDAMLVACYMDSHGLHGNVVVIPQDTDGDGVYNDLDRAAGNPYVA